MKGHNSLDCVALGKRFGQYEETRANVSEKWALLPMPKINTDSEKMHVDANSRAVNDKNGKNLMFFL